MIIGPRRLALIGAIAAVALAIILYPLIVFTPINVDKVRIVLSKLVVAEESSDQALALRLTLSVTNNNTMTLTTSLVDYDLLADGVPLAAKTLSYEDVPVNGRPALFPDTTVPLTDTISVEYSDEKSDILKRILANSTQIDWKIRGLATIESGTTQVIKDFEADLER